MLFCVSQRNRAKVLQDLLQIGEIVLKTQLSWASNTYLPACSLSSCLLCAYKALSYEFLNLQVSVAVLKSVVSPER